MKKVMITLCLAIVASTTFAQSAKYTTRMETLVNQLDTARTTAQWNNLFTAFERVAETEKTQWLPYYYAALAKVQGTRMQLGGAMGGNTATTDPAADKAELLLTKAISLSKETSETLIVTKLIASLRMMGDPMTRFQKYGTDANKALTAAKKADPNNPRSYLLEGEDRYYTPEQFGGSKTEAKKLFAKSQELYKAQKPVSTISPRWGAGAVGYFLSLK